MTRPEGKKTVGGHELRSDARVQTEPFPVVGIGSSAGGLPALKTLFSKLPSDLGAAIVLISHLAPNQPSELVNILSRCTSMNVTEVRSKTRLEPNHVYVIAPDEALVITDAEIATVPFEEPRGQRAPIDLFFRSLGALDGDSYALVLSGNGSDGSNGIRAMKEANGFILVQAPNEAEHPAMPRNAIATGCVDFVFPIDKLAEKLVELISNRRKSVRPDGHGDVVRQLMAYVRARTGHEFSNYKRSTVLRRLTRRMHLNRLHTLDEYFTLLKSNPNELKSLFKDLLISVTTFFRDRWAFQTLADQAIPAIFAKQPNGQPIRVWVAGCATGEEAYSIAILLLEAAAQRGTQPDVMIFATDLDPLALNVAREGRYPATIEADVSDQRLSTFFTREGAHYRVKKSVRDLIVFANHSVIKDPPFSRLDLVSCRNLLIYLERNLQETVLTTLHYGLKTGGFLFLGSVETTDSVPRLFRTIDRRGRLYQAIPRPANVHAPMPQVSVGSIMPSFMRDFPAAQVGGGVPHAPAMHFKALEKLAPPSVLVDRSLHILNCSETAGHFLQYPAGPPTTSIVQLARPELRLELTRALNLAIENGQTILCPAIDVAIDGTNQRVVMQVRPSLQDGVVKDLLVIFIDAGPSDADPIIASAPPADGRDLVIRLQKELELAREQLQTTRSEYDTTNEVLRATNEELRSINEEYRSTSEELETSKEELQSMNEELRTLNSELKEKVERLSSTNSDLQNLMAATEGGTLFLDTELRIKRFTPKITRHFKITASDEGRTITDFSHGLKYDSLEQDALAVLHDLIPIEREIANGSDSWLLMSIRPYRTVEDKIGGLVITFIDVTKVHQTERSLLESEQRYRALINVTTYATYRMSPDWKEMRQLDGRGFIRDIPHPSATWLDTYIAAEDQPAVLAAVDEAVRNKSTFQLEHRVQRADGTLGWAVSRAVPLLDADNNIIEWFGTASDVTARRDAQEAIRDSKARLKAIVDTAVDSIVTIDEYGIIQTANPATGRTFGYATEELIGKNIKMLMPERIAREHDGYLDTYRSTGEQKIIGSQREVEGQRKDGTTFAIDLSVAEWRDNRRFFTGIMRDISERVRAQEALANAHRLDAVGQLAGGVAHDINNLLAVICGNLELAAPKIKDEEAHGLIQIAMEAAKAGSRFNRRLLSLAIKHDHNATRIDLNARVLEAAKLLRHTLDDTIEVETDLDPNLWPTLSDPGELDSVMVNVALNARDAMPDGGRLIFKTRNIALDTIGAKVHPDAKQGDYVCLSVKDSGRGMSPEVLAHAMEPFFTTKEAGKGSGLGLGCVRNMAKGVGGFLTLESKPGLGTTVRVFLPRSTCDQIVGEDVSDLTAAPRGDGELVLVVEDNDRVREVTLKLLEALGYAVEEARTGRDAVTLLRSDKVPVDLVFSDILMPGGMTGHDLVQWIAKNRPKLPILLTTGHNRANSADKPGARIIAKPYTPAELAHAVRDALAASTLKSPAPHPG